MKLSIVMPCWLRDDRLLGLYRNCVKSFQMWTDVEHELIIVDNGSEKGRPDMEADADVYVRNERNLGYAPAVNQGYRLAKGECVAIANDDLEVWKGWTRLMESCKDGISFPRCLPDHLPMSPVQTSLKHWHADHRDADEECEMGWGALFVAKRETFDFLSYPDGLLDENFKFGMFEDTDLWERAATKGRPLVRDGQVWVWHKGSATWETLEGKDAHYEANRTYFNEKWGL